MFKDPAIDHFAKLLDWHLDKAASSAEYAFKVVSHRNTAAGSFRPGSTVIEVFEAIHAEFGAGVESALGELKRIASKTTLDRQQMRQLTEERLRAFMLNRFAGRGRDL